MKNFWGRGSQTPLLSARSRDAVADAATPFHKKVPSHSSSVAVILAILFSCVAGAALAQPANDDFANASVIYGGIGNTNGNNDDATLEANEASQVYITAYNDYNYFYYFNNPVDVGNSVWFNWTATNNGSVTFNTVGSVDDNGNPMATVLAAWTGNNVSNLTEIASDADIEDASYSSYATNYPSSAITFYAVSNTTYAISVDVNEDEQNNYGQAAAPGNYVLNWNAVQSANDLLTNATPLTGTLGSVSGSNLNAVDDPSTTNQVYITSISDYNYYDYLIDVSNSVWFTWVAPTNGVVTFNTIGSTDLITNPMDTVVAVWAGKSLTNLTLIASNLVASDDDTYDDFGPNNFIDYPSSSVTFPALAGTNYYISVGLDADDGGYPGNYVLNWNAQDPTNTDAVTFTNAVAISGYTGAVSETNLNSLAETVVGTSDNGLLNVGNCLVFKWRATQTGNFTFNTLGSVDELGNPMDTVLAVGAFNSAGTFTEISGEDNDEGNLTSSVTLDATAGTTYYFIVGVNQDAGGLAGSVVLNWTGLQTGAQASGTFQFSSSTYQFSQNESAHPYIHTGMGYIPARATITRIGGADGMADVSYYITNTWYTNWTEIVTYDVNTQMTILTTNNSGVYVYAYNTNNIEGTNNITQAYQNYNINQSFFYTFYTNSGFGLTNLYSTTPVYGPYAPFIANSFTTNNQPPVNLLPIFGTTTDIAIDPTNFTGLWASTNISITTKSVPVPAVTNSDGSVTIATNYFTYTVVIISNTVSSYLGQGGPLASSGVAVFNDYQMNYDIYIPVSSAIDLVNNANLANPLAVVVMTGASLDPLEDPTLPEPSVSATRNTAYVSFANPYAIDEAIIPYAPNGYGINSLTNNVFNFEASTLRVDKTEGTANVCVTCDRFGDNNSGATVYYRIDYATASDDYNYFKLQAGSDYARPDNAANGIYIATNDFISSSVSGQVNFPAHAGLDSVRQFISIPIVQDDTTKFNQDIFITLYYPLNVTPQSMDGYIGDINTINLTELLTTPPAGSVDTYYMAESVPAGNEPDISNPGANGPVNAIVVQPDGKAVIGGTFTAFTAQSGGQVNCITRLDTEGALDPTFSTGGASGGFGGGYIDNGVNETPAVQGLALDSNENIVAVGQFTSFENATAGGIARLLPSGAPDPAFDNSGTGANNNIWAVALQPNGQIIIGGDFTSYNGTNCNYVARLNTDGSLDTTFNPGLGPNNSVDSVAVQPNGAILIGGDFTNVDGVNLNGIARLNPDGTLDSTFNNLNVGLNGSVYALAVQTNGEILAGGDFTSTEGETNLNYLARLNPDGSVDTNFNSGTGPNNTVRCITLQSDGTFYIGGYFTYVNGTRRMGIARILSNGWLDTSFMDTAYNQFAGVPNPYYSNDPFFGNQPNPIFAIAIQSVSPPASWLQSQTYDVLIGGSFNEVGGDGGIPTSEGGTFNPTFDRELTPGAGGGIAMHPRLNVARLIGGSTPGPGNIEFSQNNYSGVNTLLQQPIQLQRVNGTLGAASVNFVTLPQGSGPGYAEPGVDYVSNSVAATWGVSWGSVGPETWMLEDGLSGVDNDEALINPGWFTSNPHYVTIVSNNYNGSVSVNLQLNNPKDQDAFFLGGTHTPAAYGGGFGNPATVEGENIPLGVALGNASAPLSITQGAANPGVLNLTANYYYTNENAGNATLTVTRTQGSAGTATLRYQTVTGGSYTAVAGRDFVATNGTLNFNGAGSMNIVVPIIYYHTNQPDRTFGVQIFSATDASLGAITNATVEIVNGNVASGIVNFVNGVPAISPAGTMTYGVSENAGQAQISVARLGGTANILQITLSTTNGTALNTTNYDGVTTNLVWASGVGGVQTVNVPVLDSGNQSSNLTVKLKLSNLMVNGSSVTNYGAYTNALLTITNTDLPGAVGFTAPSYSVNENGGSVLIPIVRTGGSAGSLTFQFYTFDGSATSGLNYQAVSNTVVFAPGQVSTNFTIGISNLNSSSDFNFYVVLTNGTPAGTITNPSVAQITINGTLANSEPPGQPDTTYGANFNGPVLGLALQTNGQMVVGGEFTNADNSFRQYVARLNSDGSLDPTFLAPSPSWGANAPVQTVAIETNGLILVGGQFNSFDNTTMNHIARLNANGSLDTGFRPGSAANNNVYAVAQTFVNGQSRVLAAGAFTAFNGNTADSIVQLLDNGGVDTSFSASANATVYSLAVQPNGQILIGGDFTNVDGVAVNHIARINANGSLDYGFTNAITSTNAGASGRVIAIAIQVDGRILIGGSFSNVDGVPCNGLARLNADGTLDSTFTNALLNPAIGANGSVNTIALQLDTRIIVGGSFSEFNGVTRNNITRLNPNGATDPTIDFGSGADGSVNAAIVQNDGNIVLGGGFLHYDGQSYPYLVRIFGGSLAGSGAFTFSSGNYQVVQNAIVAPITINRVGGTSGTNADGSGNVYVTFETVTNSGTAVAGVNYTPVSTTVVFPAGEVQQTVDVPVSVDSVVSPSSWSLGLILTNPVPASVVMVTNQPTATLTIFNTSSSVSFGSVTYSVPKNVSGGEADISLVLQGYTNQTSSVVFSTTGGTAQPGVEYTPVTPTTYTFNPGVTNINATVPIISDPNYDGDQTVTMAITNPFNTFLTPPTNATLTIRETVNAAGQIAFASPTYSVNLSSGQAVVTVIYTNGNDGVSVSYQTVPGTAVPTINYTSVSGTLNFGGAGGITQTQIDIPLLNNGGPQVPVSFSIVLTNALSGATIVQPSNTVVTIVDDLNAGIAFSSPTNSYSEGAGTVSVPVLRLGNLSNSVTVPYSTYNGTAVAGVNYVANSNKLSFVQGQGQANISVNLINNEDTTNVAFGIALYQPSTNIVQLVAPSNSVIIETPAAAGLTFASPTNSILKSGVSITLPVICLDPSNEPAGTPLSVSFATANGTAQANVDYYPTNGVLVFTNGIVTNTITVGIINNNLITGQRTFSVNLSNPLPVPPGKLVSPTSEVVTIIDENSGLSFSSPNYSVNGGGFVPITVLRVDNTNTTSTVSYATVGGGTAVPNTDYQPTNGSLTFTPGQTSVTFGVNVYGSSIVQPNKTIILQLFNPAPPGTTVLTTPSVSTLTIYNQNGGDIVPVGVSLARTNGAPNGILQSNQMAYLWFGFRDAGGLNVSNLYATLLASPNIAPTNIISGGTNETENYGSLIVGGPSASQEFTLTPSGTNGQTVAATFALTAVTVNNTTNYETNAFSLTIGSWTTTFVNTNPIFIFPSAVNGQAVIASNYPSIITVSNVGGVLVGATVTLTNFSATSPQGVGVLVVSPQQSDTLLMSGVGSPNVGANKVTLTFSDAATNSLPSTTTINQPITNGVYKPTQDGATPNFP